MALPSCLRRVVVAVQLRCLCAFLFAMHLRWCRVAFPLSLFEDAVATAIALPLRRRCTANAL
eukprot:999977-Lingulodinium_polyedra.AAC.1